MRKLISLLTFFLFFSAFCFAQEEEFSDSIIIEQPASEIVGDSLSSENVKKSGPLRNFLKKGYPNPKKAMIFSFVLPGAGQLYNKKYWKAPIVWGAYGLMIYFIDFSTGQYRFYRDEYIFAVDGDIDTESKLMTIKGWGEDDIKESRDLFRKRMELSYIGLFAISLLSGVDAFVDAHLMKFDVSEDLTMQVRPKVEFMPFEGSSLGIGFNFQIKTNKDLQPKVIFNNN